jgi:hypothetical protein
MSQIYIRNALVCTHSLYTCSLLVSTVELIFFNTKVRVWVQLRPWPIILQMKQYGCLSIHWNQNMYSTENPVSIGIFLNFKTVLISYKDFIYCGTWVLSIRVAPTFDVLLISSDLGHYYYWALPLQPNVSLIETRIFKKYSISHITIPTIQNKIVFVIVLFHLNDEKYSISNLCSLHNYYKWITETNFSQKCWN